MAFIPVMMIASAAFAAYGAIQQGKVQSANAKAQQNAENYNAAIQSQNANTASQVATTHELAARRDNQQQLGNMRAALAENGGEGGTNAGVLNQSAVNGEMNALNARYSGVLQSNNFNNQSTLDMYQAKVSGVNADSAKSASYVSAFSDVLGGATDAYGYENDVKVPRMRGSGY